jgi:acetoin utilization deacetylase AcuC-like enzyme
MEDVVEPLSEHYRRVACVMAGGTHHAFRAHGEGFCIFNDIAVAAAKAIAGSILPPPLPPLW